MQDDDVLKTINEKDFLGFRPIEHATAAGSVEVVEVLLAAEADVQAEQKYDSVLHIALDREEVAADLVAVLIAGGADIEHQGTGGGASGGAAAAQSDGPKLLAAAVVMADQPEVVDVMAAPEPEIKAFKLLGVDGEEETSKQAVSDKDKLKAEAERAKLAEKTKAEASELQAELEFARIAAAKLRLDVGAGAVGTLELGPFNLPNPGGGDDLIENANLVLVAGHRYVILNPHTHTHIHILTDPTDI